MEPIVIATRESRLALWQAEHVQALLADRLSLPPQRFSSFWGSPSSGGP